MIIEVKNSDAIFNALTFCLENKKDFKKMKDNARKKTEKHYDQKIIWENILNEYELSLENV